MCVFSLSLCTCIWYLTIIFFFFFYSCWSIVKPSSVSINVHDVEADTNLQPLLEWPQHSSPIVSLEPSQQPFYSLEANKLYAIQCLVENSRPKSHVAWFNRTAPIEVATQTLDQASPIEYLVPSKNHSSKHRLSSFIHSTAHSNGTFRWVKLKLTCKEAKLQQHENLILIDTLTLFTLFMDNNNNNIDNDEFNTAELFQLYSLQQAFMTTLKNFSVVSRTRPFNSMN